VPIPDGLRYVRLCSRLVDTVRAMEIRRLTSDDVDQAGHLYLQSAELHADLDPDYYRVPSLETVAAHYADLAERNESEPVACFVAELDEAVVGIVEVNVSDPPSSNSMLRPGRVASVDIVVEANHRRRGIGAALMQRAETWAHDQGATSLMLDMLRANEPALAFYNALGFEDHGALLLRRHFESR
jgi:GNAT superfamily N-acetyltransferase